MPLAPSGAEPAAWAPTRPLAAPSLPQLPLQLLEVTTKLGSCLVQYKRFYRTVLYAMKFLCAGMCGVGQVVVCVAVSDRLLLHVSHKKTAPTMTG